MSTIYDFSYFPVLQTDRLLLRQMTVDDAPYILRNMSDPDVVRHISSGIMHTLDDAREWLDWMNRYFLEQEGIRWGITLKDAPDTGVIGSAGIHYGDKDSRYAEIGYDFGRPFWGKGYATEVSRCLISFCWNALNLNRIEADVHDGNAASIHLLLKLGFKREGIWRQRAYHNSQFVDIHQFGLLRSDVTG